MALLGTRRTTDLDLMLPPAGGWLGYCSLDSGDPPSAGAVTLTVGDLQLVGRILPDRGGLDAPAHPRVVVAGGDGWRTLLSRGDYSSTNGVRLLTVLKDLATLAGETYDAPADVTLGPSYGWEASMPRRPIRARAVLADLMALGAIPTWRVAASGRTRFDAWPTLPAADARGRIVSRDLSRGMREVALDNSVAAFLPGATLEGVTIARLAIHEHDAELRVKVYDR